MFHVSCSKRLSRGLPSVVPKTWVVCKLVEQMNLYDWFGEVMSCLAPMGMKLRLRWEISPLASLTSLKYGLYWLTKRNTYIFYIRRVPIISPSAMKINSEMIAFRGKEKIVDASLAGQMGRKLVFCFLLFSFFSSPISFFQYHWERPPRIRLVFVRFTPFSLFLISSWDFLFVTCVCVLFFFSPAILNLCFSVKWRYTVCHFIICIRGDDAGMWNINYSQD